MPQRKRLGLMWKRTINNSRDRANNRRTRTTNFTNPIEKIYYNADNPQLSYGNNSFSISIPQPDGSRMISLVGW